MTLSLDRCKVRSEINHIKKQTSGDLPLAALPCGCWKNVQLEEAAGS